MIFKKECCAKHAHPSDSPRLAGKPSTSTEIGSRLGALLWGTTYSPKQALETTPKMTMMRAPLAQATQHPHSLPPLLLSLSPSPPFSLQPTPQSSKYNQTAPRHENVYSVILPNKVAKLCRLFSSPPPGTQKKADENEVFFFV